MDEIEERLTSTRRFLFDLPVKNQFTLSREARKEIRENLFLTISNDGEFMEWFFPNAIDPNSDNIQKQKVVEGFQWQYDDYYKADFTSRDTKYYAQSHHVYHYGSPCARIFRKGEPIYRCLTCGYDETCALCPYCFKEEYHKDHKVHITICQRENGGVCDCGDPEAWVRKYDCPYARELKGQFKILNKKLPERLEYLFFKTIETLLDYIIDVMSHSDAHIMDPEEIDVKSIQDVSAKRSLDPQKYGYHDTYPMLIDQQSKKYCLMVYNDQVRHYRDAVQRIHLTSKKVTQFATMVTDKVQSYGKAKVICSSNIELLRGKQAILGATGLATCIRNDRDVFREEMCDEIIKWISSISGSELFKINKDARDLFCKAFCCRWNNGLAKSDIYASESNYKTGLLSKTLNIPKIPSSISCSKSETAHWNFEPSLWNLPREKCEDCDYNITIDDYHPEKYHLGSRFQYLIYFDIRFWKSIRTLLHDMYSTSIITNLTYKNVISCQYVDIYPMIVDMFLIKDREPELNVMCTLSTQLFTSPSNATVIVQHGDLSRMFASIYGFLTSDKIVSQNDIDLDKKISIKSLKNRIWGQIFFDIGYILSRSNDIRTILTGNIIPMACDILALFQGNPTLRREGKAHVEYENTDYTAFFHAISVIYQFAEYIAKCLDISRDLAKEKRKEYAEKSVFYVLNYLLKLERKSLFGYVNENSDISNKLNLIWEPSTNTPIRDYRIDQEKVSFLHPLHSFLSWLMESTNFDASPDTLDILKAAAELSSYPAHDEITGESYPDPIVSLFDYPVRTTVLMSQIKSGFWVRNGFTVRSQLQLYRNTGLRESGYLRDLFLIQIFICYSHPDLSCFLIFSRWLLNDFIFRRDNDGGMPDYNNIYDQKTLPYMLEEISNFFIHIMSEDSYIKESRGESITDIRIKNEIIHNLCFGPMNYTKLCAHIPDHIVSEKRFDLILEDLTKFVPPKGCKDVGIYHLKEEYFDQTNPYYFNYSNNTKDDAIKLIKGHISKKTKRKVSDIIIQPVSINSKNLGVFKFIGNFSLSTYFARFLIRVLEYISYQDANIMDNLMETTLHLIHTCSLERNINTQEYGRFCDNLIKLYNGKSVVGILYKILINGSYTEQHSKIRTIFSIVEQSNPNIKEILTERIENFDYSVVELESYSSSLENDFEKKRRLAKERQSKLMAKFKKQQSSFLKNNILHSEEYSDVEMIDCEEGDWSFPEPHCLLCQNAAEDAGPFGIITYIHKSSEFREVPFGDSYWGPKAFSGNPNLDVSEESDGPVEYSEKYTRYMEKIKSLNVMGPGFDNQAYVNSRAVSSSCGHGMHFECYVNFLNSNRNKSNSITRNSPENTEHREFLCPLCKAINNMFIPILWTANNRSLANFLSPLHIKKEQDLTIFDDAISHKEAWFKNFTEKTAHDVESMTTLTSYSKEMISNSLKVNDNADQHFRMLLSNIFQVSSLLAFPHLYKAESAEILTNTMKSIEIRLRSISSNNGLIINQISNNCLVNLRMLNEFRLTSLYMKINHKPTGRNVKNDAYIKLLSHILTFQMNTYNQAILETDFFELFVKTLPLPSSGFTFSLILRLCYLGVIIQTFYVVGQELVNKNYLEDCECGILDFPINSNIPDDLAHGSISIFKRIVEYIPGSDAKRTECSNARFGRVLYCIVLRVTNIFLRRAAIYSFVSCARVDNFEPNMSNIEAEKLADFLKLPRIEEVVLNMNSDNQSLERSRLDSFVQHLSMAPLDDKHTNEYHRHLEYPGLIKLIDLPERLDDFFTKYYYSDRYDYPHLRIEDPAICLFCAKVVDAQKHSLGSEEGQCTTHVNKECSNNMGIFLLPKDRCMLLMYKNGGSFYTAPYLDQHGELPGDTKRGNTLYLSDIHYKDFIKNIWLQHNIPNYIVRKLDSVMDAGGWDTL
ncbi:Piso0_002534 [Millerozyma farinosa CBS 7064]|uniref:E3 ubiquitin-protein ligase n=1 Tax=Pichia sorbitophila (strain ATCC MYA-4447 / BCRC 22081 / CBS 7064 / NBRC 10061 / NRRL Y-12695) TaxID=559304 RepID=G8YCV7_PICSO|nr:Piso0_002534 [Millerozyma farinosa CBS 7064]